MSAIAIRIPLNEEDFKSDKKIETLVSGSKTTGLIIGITKSELLLNGYYTDGTKRYKCLSKGVKISWEEVERLQKELKNKSKRKSQSKTITDEFIDEEYTQEYLDTLPVVTINERKFYIDTTKRERRLVERPEAVSKF